MKARHMGVGAATTRVEDLEHWSLMRLGMHGWKMRRGGTTKSKNWGYKIQTMDRTAVEALRLAAPEAWRLIEDGAGHEMGGRIHLAIKRSRVT